MQKIIVITVWGITFLFFPWHWVGGSNFVAGLVPYLEASTRTQIIFWWLCTLLASTATALSLGLKSIFLALPGLLFLPFAIVTGALSVKHSDARAMYLSLLFFLFFTTCGSLLLRSYKEEKIQKKIYLGALVLIALLVATFLFAFKRI